MERPSTWPPRLPPPPPAGRAACSGTLHVLLRGPSRPVAVHDGRIGPSPPAGRHARPPGTQQHARAQHPEPSKPAPNDGFRRLKITAKLGVRGVNRTKPEGEVSAAPSLQGPRSWACSPHSAVASATAHSSPFPQTLTF